MAPPPVVAAAREGDLHEVMRLAPVVASPGGDGWSLRHALIDASLHGHTGVVDFLLTQYREVCCYPPLFFNTMPWDPLLLAARAGHADVVAVLLKVPIKDIIDLRTDIFTNREDHLWRTPYAYLARRKSIGHSALMLAAAEGNTACVELLLKAGADPSHSALMLAAAEGNPGCVELLLKAGADMHGPPDEPTALMVAHGKKSTALLEQVWTIYVQMPRL